MTIRLSRNIALIGAAALVLGCSSGGGDDSSTSTTSTAAPPATTSGPAWTQGVFEASSVFKDSCAIVRVGQDLEGNFFPDRPGSLADEKFWLRSWTQETYLWNDEVTDRDPNTFNTPTDYFAVLRTTEVTASGADKDQFHFSLPTEEYLQNRLSTPLPDYGARFIELSNTVPRDVRVLYTEPGTPASELVGGQANLVRGSRILEVDGVDLVNGGATQAEIDILNRGFAPTVAGEQHVFVVQDPGAAGTRTITLTAADIAPIAVNRFSVINTGTGDVGYLLINTLAPFAAEADIANAFQSLQASGVSDLVLDLRYNNGGLLAVAAQVGYMIAGAAPSNGRTFEGLQFNDDAGNLNPVTGQFNEPVPFFNEGLGFSLTAGAALPSLNLSRVFILSTEETCSGAESIVNALRGINVDVILIGRPTCGKPFGFYPQDNCGETYFTIQFQGVNDQGFGDYADGFIAANSNAAFGVRVPGCAVADDLDNELGDTSEALLAAALQYRSTATCPAPPPVATASISGRSIGDPQIKTTPRAPIPPALRGARDMTLPE